MGPLKIFQYLYDNKYHKIVDKDIYMRLKAKTVLKDTYTVHLRALNVVSKLI